MPALPFNDPRIVALFDREVVWAMLFRIGLNPVRRLTTWPADMPVGADTWVSGDIVGFDLEPPQAGTTLGRAQYTLTLAGSEWKTRFGAYLGVTLAVDLRLMSQGAWLADTLQLYRGRCVGIAYPSASTAQAAFAGRFAQVDPRSSVLLTDADQRRRDADDTSLARIGEVRSKYWGRD